MQPLRHNEFDDVHIPDPPTMPEPPILDPVVAALAHEKWFLEAYDALRFGIRVLEVYGFRGALNFANASLSIGAPPVAAGRLAEEHLVMRALLATRPAPTCSCPRERARWNAEVSRVVPLDYTLRAEVSPHYANIAAGRAGPGAQ